MHPVLFCFVFKIENELKLMYCCFQLAKLNDHLFEKELFIRLTVRVYRAHLSVCDCASYLFVLRVGSGIWF